MITRQPLVTVIIPIYNAKRYIREAIESILSQTYAPLEIIAIEDGSSESSEHIVAEYPQVTYLLQPRSGHAAARNRGIALARGHYISFLDADDVYTPDKLSQQVTYLASHPEDIIVAGLTHEFNDPGITTPVWMREAGQRTSHRGASPSTWLVRRSAFDLVGRFNETFWTMCDTDWLLRMKRAGYRLPFIDQVVLHKRNHTHNQSAHSTSAARATYHRDLIRLFRRRDVAPAR